MQPSLQMSSEELEARRNSKIAEIEADIEVLQSEMFQRIENVQRLEKMLQKEITLLKKASITKLDQHLTTCNYAYYKSIIEEVTDDVIAVLKSFRREETALTVDIVHKNQHSWTKLVNRPAKTLLIEFRDGKRNSDVIQQLKLFRHVARHFNRPTIRVLFKNGVLAEMADKLTRKGIEVIGERIERNAPELKGKWNEELLERLAEENDSDWGEDEDLEAEQQLTRPHSSSIPTLNLDINAVILLCSNLCEQGGADLKFKYEMINAHAAGERRERAKPELLKKLQGHRLIMSKTAFEEAADIVRVVGGEHEKARFEELSRRIEPIEDEPKDVGRVAQLPIRDDIQPITRKVFSVAESQGVKTVTANSKFLKIAENLRIYFPVIEIPPRPLTEQKEVTAEPL